MATIAELAQMSANAYNGTRTSNPNTPGSLLKDLNSYWQVFSTSTADPTQKSWSQGYFGVAYYNTVTGET